MTSPSRRKRPTTAHAPTTPARTPVSRGGVALPVLIGLLLAGTAPAQQPWPLPPPLPVVSSSTPTAARWMAPTPVAVPRPAPSFPSPPVAARSGGIVPVRYQRSMVVPDP